MKEDNLLSFVVDQLSEMGAIESRRMFGGWHVSQGGVFFGIVFKERLYFKTNETTRLRYEEMGMGPFRPRAKVTLKSLYEVPVDILEDGDEIVSWAWEAVACQVEAGRKEKTPRARKRKKT